MTSAPGPASTFTCASCRALFGCSDAQRAHYQGEWHRYNLRRKVAGLPPLDEAAHRARASSAAQQHTAAEAEAAAAALRRECLACGRGFHSAAAYAGHLASRKHVAAAARLAQSGTERVVPERGAPAGPVPPAFPDIAADATDAQVDAAIAQHVAAAPDRLGPRDCLYCARVSFASVEDLLAHMHAQHSFYIPDLELLRDLPGLLAHLADKVAVWRVCLHCGGEGRAPFASLAAVRRHMRDKGHTGLRYDDEGSAELAPFYDFSALRPHPPSALDSDSEAWEEISDADADAVQDTADTAPAEFDDALILAPDESELILPNGRRLGSRTYRHYYRQYLVPYLGGSESSDEDAAAIADQPQGQWPVPVGRAGGALSRGQPPVPLSAQEKRLRRQEHDALKTFALGIGMRANGLQKHYREQLLQ